MNVLLLLVPLSLATLGLAVWAFAWAVRRGQFEDLDTPALAILVDDARVGDAPVEAGRIDQGCIDQGCIDQGCIDQGCIDQGCIDEGCITDDKEPSDGA